MDSAKPIHFWNPYTKEVEIEKVYGGNLVGFVYSTPWGQLLSKILSKPFFSRTYGWLQDSSLSKKYISPFIKEYSINMEEYEKRPFRSFNDFFTRRFLPGKRFFSPIGHQMPAFAEGRYLAFGRATDGHQFPVKSEFLSPTSLVGRADKAAPFVGGPIFIARLCPTDYHRFHFPDWGEVVDQWKVPGALHSVNPVALKFKADIFATNERHVTLLKTKNFGTLAYIEIGAICVGKIIQSYKESHFNRGDEKGYFLFGASTVVVLGEPGKWRPREDVLQKSIEGLETFVRLGDPLT